MQPTLPEPLGGALTQRLLREKPRKSTKSRKNVTRACDSCRRRRRRCNGQALCSGCAKSGKNCTYALPDFRSIRPRAQDIEILYEQSVVLDGLLNAIKQGQADDLLFQIREGASWQDLSRVLDSSLAQTPLAKEDSPTLSQQHLPSSDYVEEGQIHPSPNFVDDATAPLAMIGDPYQVSDFSQDTLDYLALGSDLFGSGHISVQDNSLAPRVWPPSL